MNWARGAQMTVTSLLSVAKPAAMVTVAVYVNDLAVMEFGKDIYMKMTMYVLVFHFCYTLNKSN